MKLHRSTQFVVGALACLATSTLFTSQAAAQCLIEPFGDSITAGVDSTPLFLGKTRGAGYRSTLAALAPVLGLVFVGGRDDNVPESIPNPYPPLYSYYDSGAGPWVMPYHSGVPGWRNDQLLGTVVSRYPIKPFVTTPPHIVLVHSGTNDLYQAISAASAAIQHYQLLDALAARYPLAKIIVAKIIPFAGPPALNQTVSDYNNGGSVWPFAPGVVQNVAALNLKYPDKFSTVDMNGPDYPFPPVALAPDGIHPNDAGYAEMARRWSKAIKLVAWSAGCMPL